MVLEWPNPFPQDFALVQPLAHVFGMQGSSAPTCSLVSIPSMGHQIQ
jgi:hypothetical protein